MSRSRSTPVDDGVVDRAFERRPVDPEAARGVALGVEVDDQDAVTRERELGSPDSPPSWSCRRRPSGLRRRSSGPLSGLLGRFTRIEFYHRWPFDLPSGQAEIAGASRMRLIAHVPSRTHRSTCACISRETLPSPRRDRRTLCGTRSRCPFRRLRGILPPRRRRIGRHREPGWRARTFRPLRRGIDPSDDPAPRCGRRGGDGPDRTHRYPIPPDRACPATSGARARRDRRDRGRSRSGAGLGLRRRARTRCPGTTTTWLDRVRAPAVRGWRVDPGPLARPIAPDRPDRRRLRPQHRVLDDPVRHLSAPSAPRSPIADPLVHGAAERDL